MATFYFESKMEDRAAIELGLKYERLMTVVNWVLDERPGDTDAEDVVTAYRQVLALRKTTDPAVRDALWARIAVVRAEMDRQGAADSALAEMSDRPVAARFAAGLRFAYGYRDTVASLDPDDVDSILAPDRTFAWRRIWTTARLMARADRRAGRETEAGAIEAAFSHRLERDRLRLLAALAPLFVVIFSGAALWAGHLVRRRRPRLRVAQGRIPAPWFVADGFTGCVWAGLAAQVLLIPTLLSDRGIIPAGLGLALSFLGILPFVVLLRWLLAPSGLTIKDALGLEIEPGSRTRLLAACLMFGAVDILLECVLLGVLPSRNPEWWEGATMQSLLLGPWVARVAFAGMISISVPMMEETAFRGVLYSTARRFLRPVPAAFLIGALFGLMHDTTPAGLLAIGMGGAWCALAYEVTGSLWPSFIMHAFNNLLISIVVMTASSS